MAGVINTPMPELLHGLMAKNQRDSGPLNLNSEVRMRSAGKS
jgi:hypothetical protein